MRERSLMEEQVVNRSGRIPPYRTSKGETTADGACRRPALILAAMREISFKGRATP